MSTQQQNLNRTTDAHQKTIKDFCRDNAEFSSSELYDYVNNSVEGYVAPETPGRVLRRLRQIGEIDYIVVSRSKGTYHVFSVSGS